MTVSRHLHSALHPFTRLWVGFSWRAFTLSVPLQPGIWLGSRLRPPFHALAFSRPITGQAGLGVPQFQSMMWSRSVAAPYAPGALWSNPGPPTHTARQAPSHFGSGVSASCARQYLRRLRWGFLSSA
jgi:hypothetical protein